MDYICRTTKLLLLIGCLSINACAHSRPAPIVEGWHQPPARQSDYIVQKGDTLYSIAWAFDMDFRDLARINHLASPYHLEAGQRLQMASSPTVKTFLPLIHSPAKLPAVTYRRALSTPIKITHKNLPAPTEKKVVHIHQLNSRIKKPTGSYVFTKHWIWPTQGKLFRGFSLASGGNRGLEIAGKLGQPIFASAPGRVVYAGSGLRGYGNLIIIKHNDTYLSAYAFNKVMLVKEGFWVKSGQKIALMGQNNAGRVLLHFEIRRNGKPINPLHFLT